MLMAEVSEGGERMIRAAKQEVEKVEMLVV
jgi:hypothetical protein